MRSDYRPPSLPCTGLVQPGSGQPKVACSPPPSMRSSSWTAFLGLLPARPRYGPQKLHLQLQGPCFRLCLFLLRSSGTQLAHGTCRHTSSAAAERRENGRPLDSVSGCGLAWLLSAHGSGSVAVPLLSAALYECHGSTFYIFTLRL